MEEPKSLDSLFKEKIFRIPDYQRGYAWQKGQLKDFWEDLVNLSENRSHYTGVLTLKELPNKVITKSDKEFWLVDDHSYRMYHVVDGQQRLTTFVIFLQAFIDFIKSLPGNKGKAIDQIYITESLSLAEIINKYLYKIKPTGDRFRTYKFGYTEDNPSYEYLRYRILGEDGAGSINGTFYTLNLKNAKVYFSEQLSALYQQFGIEGFQDVYKKLTNKFLFNEYVIRDEFDVFVAFETMNNRGKKLSDLELLKNRLIYLTTLYGDDDLDDAERRSIREKINEAWKEVYYQLGRNEKKPLNDDEFLRAHWIMYFKYSRETGRDYSLFLLDEYFSPRQVHKKVEREVALEEPEEQISDLSFEDLEEENGDEIEENKATVLVAKLKPTEIKNYINSLKTCSLYWFESYFPGLVNETTPSEKTILEKLNRIGMGYFRPLIMAILKNERNVKSRIWIFKRIERFIFLAFRIGSARANYRSSEFYNAARELDRKKITLKEIDEKLTLRLSFIFDDDGNFSGNEFYNLLEKKFKSGSGYYGWSGLRYFLYEYESNLLDQSRQKKVDWEDLTPRGDQITIEHIFPQTPTTQWRKEFSGVKKKDYTKFAGSIGNLLLLSKSINSSLQNDSFKDKKNPKYDSKHNKIRNGYSDGSHSEIEVAQCKKWGPEQVRERGLKLLSFLENRWEINFGSKANKDRFLFIQ